MNEKYSHREYRQLLIEARELDQEPKLEKVIPRFAAADYCLKYLIECYPVLGKNKPLQIGTVKQIERPCMDTTCKPESSTENPHR